jgi:organic hydroperoxide reductase OsmC/OhrA
MAPSRAHVEAPPRAPLVGGPPPEFGGDPTTWSPEHLLCSALGLCLFTTFEALAAHDKLFVIGWQDDVTGVLDKTGSGLRFTSFNIDVELTVAAEDVTRAEATLARAKHHCIISNALSVPITLSTQIWEHDQRAHA